MAPRIDKAPGKGGGGLECRVDEAPKRCDNSSHMQMNTFWEDTSITEMRTTSDYDSRSSRTSYKAGCNAQALYSCLGTNYESTGALNAWLPKEQR